MTVFTGGSGCGRYRNLDREIPRDEHARRCESPWARSCSTSARCMAWLKPPPLLLKLLHRLNHQRLLSRQLLEFPVLLFQLFDPADL